ncbi:MAG TPA: multiheme c-type cytochrome [Sedimentisphaerales bacterium]|nr:multiheme c-type cytochrome [Sedimentisphaerales bacterium]HRS11717.1 multiheme c-type cytochrome [Sedimentisphaerales bacterium]HRV48380.1 multiheme c-type cytochrome [Sedimentisphaerales bacterium]
MLDEGPATTTSDQPAANNSRCFVCHANYLDEKIARTHARAGIGCATCHGASDAHIADESWASGGNGTAPDIMFPKERVNPSCMACHPKDKIDTTEHKPLFADSAQHTLCTDCHGNHRLPMRRSSWK